MTNPLEITYGEWTIHFDPPPIPIRDCDWHFEHRDFDADWDGEGYVGNGLCGSAASVDACKREIDEIEEDRDMPRTAQTFVHDMLAASIR